MASGRRGPGGEEQLRSSGRLGIASRDDGDDDDPDVASMMARSARMGREEVSRYASIDLGPCGLWSRRCAGWKAPWGWCVVLGLGLFRVMSVWFTLLEYIEANVSHLPT